MDATPVPCGQSAVTAKRSGLGGYAGYGYRRSHSRWYWGCKLLLICTCDGTVTGFSLANPKLHGERDQARQTLEHQPANRPAPGSAVVTDKGLSGQDTEAFFAGDDLCLTLVGLPARTRRHRGRSRMLSPARRGGHLDAEEPARTRTPRRPHPRRPVDPRHPAAPRPQHGHLAQLDDRRTRQAVPDRLRPHLTGPHSPINDLAGTRRLNCSPIPPWLQSRRSPIPPLPTSTRSSPSPSSARPVRPTQSSPTSQMSPRSRPASRGRPAAGQGRVVRPLLVNRVPAVRQRQRLPDLRRHRVDRRDRHAPAGQL